MAYSTRNQFFKWDFDREEDLDCRCVKMKTYQSTFDDRSWALSADQKSQFFADLVKCDTIRPPDESEEEENDRNQPTTSSKRKNRASEVEENDVSVPKKKKRKSTEAPVHAF